MKKPVFLGGIVRITANSMYGFQVGFKTKDEANQYKEMLKIILGSDKYKVEYQQGYHDDDRCKK